MTRTYRVPATYCPACGAMPDEPCRGHRNRHYGPYYQCDERQDLSVERVTVDDVLGYPDGATVDVQTDRGSWPSRAVVYAPVDGRPVAVVWRHPKRNRYGWSLLGTADDRVHVDAPCYPNRSTAVADAVRTAAEVAAAMRGMP